MFEKLQDMNKVTLGMLVVGGGLLVAGTIKAIKESKECDEVVEEDALPEVADA